MTSKSRTGKQTKAPSDHAARRTIAAHETLGLSERDRAAFFEAIISPPAPSEGLARAFAEHGRRIGA